MDKVDITTFRLLGLMIGTFFLTGNTLAQSTQDSTKTVAYTENISSSQVSQDSNPSITLELDQVPLGEALKRIAEQAEGGLYYNAALLPKKTVSLRLHAVPLDKALRKVLKGTSLKVITFGRNITLRRKEEIHSISLPLANIQETIIGTVTDASTGETLPGVNVVVKGTNQGTSTGADGRYNIEVASLQDTLVFSFVGYQSQEVPISDRSQIDVELSSQAVMGEEMVVIGYGEVEVSDLTGSVSRVDGETFQNQSMTQVTDMLTGTVAGINANQSTSAAGGGSLEIRGPTSLNAGTSPMIVLDGVVYNGLIRDINPADIKTIDVLKDASSAAIFGAKAASGVILITTSKGAKGKPTINFSSSVGRMEATNNNYGVRGPDEYIEFRKSYYRESTTNFPDHYWDDPGDLREGITLEEWRALNPNPLPDDTREYLSRLNFFPVEIEKFLAGETIDWFDKTMQAGTRLNSNISIGGGTEDTQYYLSVGYINNEGIIRGDQFSTLRTRLNVDYQVADWLNVGTNTQYSVRDESSVPADLIGMQRTSPYAQFRNEDGTLNWFPGGYSLARNPLRNTLGQDKDRKINSLFSSLYAKISLPFGISHQVSFQPRYVNSRDYNYWSPQTIAGGQDVSGGIARRTDFSQFEWIVDNLLKWNKDIGVHGFDLTLLHSVEKNKTWNSFMQNNTFNPSPILGYSGLQFGINPTLSTEDTEVTGDALMGRLNYSLLDKYLLTASIRRDGYSAFGQENPRAVFPAVALAWRISEEDFFNVDLINQLKLRLSWGVNGNRDIGIYSSLAQLGSNQYYDGSSVQIGVYTSTLANPNLSWEETESINIGLDLGMINDRVNLILNYYDMTTNNLLVNRTLPEVTGFDNVTTNIGELGNKGFEMTLNTVNINSSSVNWESDVVFSLNRNKIKELFGETGEYTLMGETLTGEIPDFQNEWFPGHSIDEIWDYDMTGIWQEDEREEAAEYGMEPGDIKARDIDGNGDYEELEDKRFIGYTEPRFRIGLRNQVIFLQNFSASVFIRADLGHDLPFPHAIHAHSTYGRLNTAPTPYWTKENQSNEWPRLSQNDAQYGGGIMMYKPASFVRIQDLSLSYTLPATLLERYPLQNLRIYGSVRNLATFTNWPGWDPESGFNRPMPRTITIGLNLSL